MSASITIPTDYSKKFAELSHEEVVEVHLSLQTIRITSDFALTSCLHELESATRHSRGLRNTRIFAPSLCAFAILDQIGSCYKDLAKPAHPNEGSGIPHALYYFCNMNAMSEEVKALYAFRNGLVHDGSFTNQSKKTRQWYMFRFDSELPLPIRLANTPWDGSASNVGHDTTTYINMRIFTDLVLSSLDNLRRSILERKNDIEVLYSREDIIHKFILWRPVSSLKTFAEFDLD